MTYTHCTLEDTYRVILIAFPLQQWLRERCVTLYALCLSCEVYFIAFRRCKRNTVMPVRWQMDI